MEKTLVMVKPHAMKMHVDIIRDFELKIRGHGNKIFTGVIDNVSKDFFDEFYSSNRTKHFPWWDELMEKDFVGGSIFAAAYEGVNVVSVARNIVGPTQVLENSCDTLRGKYGRRMIDEGKGIVKLSNGMDVYRNVIHATDETPGEFNREFGILEKYLKF